MPQLLIKKILSREKEAGKVATTTPNTRSLKEVGQATWGRHNFEDFDNSKTSRLKNHTLEILLKKTYFSNTVKQNSGRILGCKH